MNRRTFLLATAVSAFAKDAGLNHKQRVDRALAGKDVDRPPFSFWHHFGLPTAEAHAKRTLEFHAAYRTDIVKVMSDFPYPKPTGKWYDLKPIDNPFPDQLHALDLIRSGLNGDAYYLETVFNPWNVAEKLSSKAELLRLKQESPEKLLDALDVITKSEIDHAKLALAQGASGILFSVANANAKEMSLSDYRKFSAPFDKRFFEATSGAPLNILHLHVEREYLSEFRHFSAPVINYSLHVSGISIADVRKEFRQVIMGGIDEVNYKTLSAVDLEKQWKAARSQAGGNFILTPGCSVPNDSSAQELARLPKSVGA